MAGIPRVSADAFLRAADVSHPWLTPAAPIRPGLRCSGGTKGELARLAGYRRHRWRRGGAGSKIEPMGFAVLNRSLQLPLEVQLTGSVPAPLQILSSVCASSQSSAKLPPSFQPVFPIANGPTFPQEKTSRR